MSYNIGQFRKDTLPAGNEFLTVLNSSIDEVDTQSNDSLSTYNFKDKAIALTSGSFSYGKNYYVRLGLVRPEDFDQKITFNLKSQYSSQTLDEIVIPKRETSGSLNNTIIIELVFSPNASYDQLLLTLQRIPYDYMIQNEDQSFGRKIEVAKADNQDILKTYQINNILTSIERNELNKIGIQGPPGMLMCINGQGIRIGPNGIYEIKNNYKITFMGFVVENSNSQDYFILDYQY